MAGNVRPWKFEDLPADINFAEHLIRITEALMATQADIDAFTTRINTATDAIRGEITTLQQQLAAAGVDVDLSGLDTAVTGLESIEPAAPAAPTTDAPADPTTPDAPAAVTHEAP
jgi:hypothetical protein